MKFLLDTTAIKDNSISSESDDSTWLPDENRNRKKVNVNQVPVEATELDLVLTEREWNTIKQDGTVMYGKRETEILQPKVWTNVISIAFWKQHKTRCAFAFKRAHVKYDPENDSNVVKIYGKCMSAACGNKFRGHGEKVKDIDGIIIHVDTRDTRLESHEDIKRPFNGDRRKREGQNMIHEGCSGWSKRQAREIMSDDDIAPADLPNADVQREAKKQAIHANLNVQPGDSRDLIRTIENISTDTEYVDLIQAVGSMPFYVFYSTPAQLDAYKKYLSVNKAKSVISVDSTGCVVRKLDRPGDTKTGHIFLYSIVINFEGSTQPVHQMLSEKHDTDFIEYWLKQWLRRGAAKPKEAVSDYSRALINAMCLAFNNRTTKSYLEICFAIIENASEVIERPSTIIRIDVAHLIHMVCRWPCFDKVNQSCIKDFFVRCVALMVESSTLNQVQRVFTLTCAVGLHTHEDTELALEFPLARTAKDARHMLEGYIGTREIEDKLEKHKPRDESDYTAGPFELDITDDSGTHDDDTKSHNGLLNWVAMQKERAGKTVHKGRDPNAFYLPNFIERLHKLANEFPLWTGVLVPSNSAHATSSYVEGYFNDIKTRVFTSVKAPARVDIFLKTHARNIIGETRLFVSKLKKSEMEQAELERKQKSPNERQYADQKQPGNHQAVIKPGEINEAVLEKIEDLSQTEGLSKDTYIPELPHLDLHMEDLSFFENESCVLSPPSYNNVTLEDSDLKSTEDWRKKANLYKSVDNFDDINPTAECEVHTRVNVSPVQRGRFSIEELADYVCLDHSYSHSLSQRETSQSLIAEFPVDDVGLEDRRNTVDDETSLPPSSGINVADSIALQKPKVATKSKYFKSFPEIRQRNLLTTKLMKPHLLPNGNRCRRGVAMDGDTVFVRNTCPFDSLVHILMTRAIDDVHYASYIEKSKNKTLRYVSAFMKSGPNADILRQRVKILQCIYDKKITLETEKRVLSYTVDAWDSIENIVKHTMSSEPSVSKTEKCSRCSTGRTYSLTTISPNHNVISKKGFGALGSALAFKAIVNGLSCNNCPGKCTSISEPLVHLFIDLDIREIDDDSPDRPQTGLQCRLKDVPRIIDLERRVKRSKRLCTTARYRYIIKFYTHTCIPY